MQTITPLNEVLAFTLGTEEYGIDIQKMQEIRGYEAVTHIANAPDYLKGVVNLRGLIETIIACASSSISASRLMTNSRSLSSSTLAGA